MGACIMRIRERLHTLRQHRPKLTSNDRRLRCYTCAAHSKITASDKSSKRAKPI